MKSSDIKYCMRIVRISSKIFKKLSVQHEQRRK